MFRRFQFRTTWVLFHEYIVDQTSIPILGEFHSIFFPWENGRWIILDVERYR